MIIEYKNMRASISYSATTKSYHGAIEDTTEVLIAFQASYKHEIIDAMHKAVDHYLESSSLFLNLS